MAINTGINPEDILGAFAGLPYTLNNMQAQIDPVSAVLSRMGQGPFDGTANRTDDGFPTFEKFQSDMRKQEPPGPPPGATFNTSIDMGLSPDMAARLAIVNADKSWDIASQEQKQQQFKTPESKAKSITAEIVNNNPSLMLVDYNSWASIKENEDVKNKLENTLTQEGVGLPEFWNELDQVQHYFFDSIEESDKEFDLFEIEDPTTDPTAKIPTWAKPPAIIPGWDIPDWAKPRQVIEGTGQGIPEGTIEEEPKKEIKKWRDPLSKEERKALRIKDATDQAKIDAAMEEKYGIYEDPAGGIGSDDLIDLRQQLLPLLEEEEEPSKYRFPKGSLFYSDDISPREKYLTLVQERLGYSYLPGNQWEKAHMDKFDILYGTWILESLIPSDEISITGKINNLRLGADEILNNFQDPHRMTGWAADEPWADFIDRWLEFQGEVSGKPFMERIKTFRNQDAIDKNYSDLVRFSRNLSPDEKPADEDPAGGIGLDDLFTIKDLAGWYIAQSPNMQKYAAIAKGDIKSYGLHGEMQRRSLEDLIRLHHRRQMFSTDQQQSGLADTLSKMKGSAWDVEGFKKDVEYRKKREKALVKVEEDPGTGVPGYY